MNFEVKEVVIMAVGNAIGLAVGYLLGRRAYAPLVADVEAAVKNLQTRLSALEAGAAKKL
jgi:membrane protein YqaA with SNARE-associated domain